MEHLNAIGQRSRFACPECSGVLWEINESRPKRYRCHTGHGYTLRTLADAHEAATDEALWGAMRALQEREALLRQLASEDATDSEGAGAAELLGKAERSASHSDQLRGMIQTE